MKIHIKEVSKRYTLDWIIRRANFHFNQNIIYGIGGHNGSGKSTLLQIISGYLSPSEGSVIYERSGQSIDRASIYKYISYTGPYVDLIESYTVPELYSYYTKFKSLLPEIDLAEFIRLSDTGKHKNKSLQNFSSGMKQRVQLLLALVTQVPVILLDEPSSFLDLNNKAWFYQNLKEFSHDRLVIITTNDPEDLSQCNQVLQLEELQNK